MARRNSNSRRRTNRNSQDSQKAASGTYVPSSLSLRNTQKARYVTTVILTGTNVTPATTTGYAYLTVTSGLWTSSSPWTALDSLYQFVKPDCARISVTFNRATGSSDNPRVSFVPTPDGNAVGNLGMNLSTLESATGRSFVGGPGQTIAFNCEPAVLLSAYNTVSNGYMSVRPQRLSTANLPLVYYGDLLLYTPGINLSLVPQYIQIKIEFAFQFEVLTTATQ